MTEILRQEQIRYRWEVLWGLSFMYDNKKLMIKTVEQMKEFLVSTKKDIGKNQQNQGKIKMEIKCVNWRLNV